MASVILIDSNIPMYLVGGDAGAKVMAESLVSRAAGEGARLVTDAEVLQEIVHRYASIGRHQAIQPAFEALLDFVVAVHPITLEVANGARDIALAHRDAKARDAIHVAVTRTSASPRSCRSTAGWTGSRGFGATACSYSSRTRNRDFGNRKSSFVSSTSRHMPWSSPMTS